MASLRWMTQCSMRRPWRRRLSSWSIWLPVNAGECTDGGVKYAGDGLPPTSRHVPPTLLRCGELRGGTEDCTSVTAHRELCGSSYSYVILSGFCDNATIGRGVTAVLCGVGLLLLAVRGRLNLVSSATAAVLARALDRVRGNPSSHSCAGLRKLEGLVTGFHCTTDLYPG